MEDWGSGLDFRKRDGSFGFYMEFNERKNCIGNDFCFEKCLGEIGGVSVKMLKEGPESPDIFKVGEDGECRSVLFFCEEDIFGKKCFFEGLISGFIAKVKLD